MERLEQHSMVVVCTSHLTPATAEALSTLDSASFPFPVAAYEEGFFVACGMADQRTAADSSWPDLHAVRQWAYKLGFNYVMLDRDASPVEGLPEYDWG